MRWFLSIGPAVFAASTLAAQMDTVTIQTVPVSSGVYMLMGSGGNIGVSVGDDAVFLVDDQFAPLSAKITAAVKALSDKPIKFLLNTHWHGDHTGGNENFGNAGVVIVAHDNVRQRMSVDQFMARFNQTVKASPKVALPVVTFGDLVTFHLNGDDIHAIHVKNAHTDGDVVVHWVKANAMHMGDTFFNGMYPFIDLGSGGSVNGVIEAVATALTYADENTKIIPGHGPLANRADMIVYRDMLIAVRNNVRRLVAQKKTLKQTLAAKPSAAWDAKWGGGFMKPDDFVTAVYESVTMKKAN
jgi:glyoxylase-like metal-dependent hydrolase (beta-lactamase superfamily II)